MIVSGITHLFGTTFEDRLERIPLHVIRNRWPREIQACRRQFDMIDHGLMHHTGPLEQLGDCFLLEPQAGMAVTLCGDHAVDTATLLIASRE